MSTLNLNIKQSQIKEITGVSLKEVKKFIIEYEDSSGKSQKKFKSGKEGIRIQNFKKLLSFRYSSLNGEKIDITNKIHAYMNIRPHLKTISQLSSLFNKFLHKYISFFCGRCEGIGHHKGLINEYLRPINRYKPDMINRFFGDVEHGFFHGLMAAFICYLINEDEKLIDQKTNSLEKIFMSATLHDFLKANGVEQKEHDIQLKKLFPKLCEETYVHSDPPKKFHNKHLIIADRLELRRYPDYKDWVDQRFYNLYDTMKSSTVDLLNLFYDNFRPALQYIYTHQFQPFLRHGPELEQDKLEDFFPPSNTTYVKTTNLQNLYPIETDLPPFCSVGENGEICEKKSWYNDNQHGYCSNHDGMAAWNIVKGYIAISNFKKNGVVVNSDQRDHLYAKSQIPIKEWIFIYQNLEKAHNLKKTTQDTSYLKSRKGVNPFAYLDMLINNKNAVASQESIFLMFQFIRMFKCRIVVLQ